MQKNLVAYPGGHPEADSCDVIASLFWLGYLQNVACSHECPDIT